MSKLVLDAATAAKLRAMLADGVTLVDESGAVLGECFPVEDDEPIPPEAEFTDEETRAAFDTDDPGITTAEMIAKLRSL